MRMIVGYFKVDAVRMHAVLENLGRFVWWCRGIVVFLCDFGFRAIDFAILLRDKLLIIDE